MREEARVGDRILEITSRAFKKSGKAASELGVDLGRILADPNLMEEYGRQGVGLIAAYWAWTNADNIKFSMYKLRAWIEGKGGVGGDQTQWWWWAAFLIEPVGATVGLIYDANQATKKVSSEADAYKDAYVEWQKGVNAAQAHLEQLQQQRLQAVTPETQADLDGQIQTQQYLLDFARQHPPKKPAFMSATFEEHLLYAAMAYIVASHPEVLAEAIKGLGFTLQGIGEIIPL